MDSESALGHPRRFSDVRCTSADTPIAHEIAKPVEFSVGPKAVIAASRLA